MGRFHLNKSPEVIGIRTPFEIILFSVDFDLEFVIKSFGHGFVGEVENVAAALIEQLVHRPPFCPLGLWHGISPYLPRPVDL